MTDLERRALLGDREAQEECTRQGIVIPCHCGSEARLFVDDAGVKIICHKCGAQSKTLIDLMTFKTNAVKSVIESWNTRAAPPVGRCETCRWFADNNRGQWYGCKLFNAILVVPEDAPKADDYCSEYEPKEA